VAANFKEAKTELNGAHHQFNSTLHESVNKPLQASLTKKDTLIKNMETQIQDMFKRIHTAEAENRSFKEEVPQLQDQIKELETQTITQRDLFKVREENLQDQIKELETVLSSKSKEIHTQIRSARTGHIFNLLGICLRGLVSIFPISADSKTRLKTSIDTSSASFSA
jgi:predicted RNase H-like nuclease (RuvC/YqgF family)